MKSFKMIGLALMATLTGVSFSTCTSETEEVLGQDTEIRLTSEITPSRVTSLNYQSTQIVANQQVGVTITGAKTTHNNVAWTAGADGALTNTGSALYYGTGTATITAYHPHNSAWTGTSHTFSVSTDQSIEANYRNSDLLWATASSGKTANAVALTFTHKLAKINVTLQSTDITNLSGATISICGTNIATNFNPSTGALSAATTNVQEIKAGVTTAAAKTASAIIVPQKVAAGTPFIKITLGEKVFYHKLSAEKTFASGKSYSYTLNVKENSVEITATENITDWGQGDAEPNIGDAEEIDLSWFNPNQYITYVANYESYYPNDDWYQYSSYIVCPSVKISKIEFKYKMNEPSSTSYAHYLCCQNQASEKYDSRITLTQNGLNFNGENMFSWNELNVSPTDCMVLAISFKDHSIKINNTDLNYTMSENSFNSSYLFTRYYSENDEGLYRIRGEGVPEGSKLYYVKIWNENDELVYLGAASKALNPTTGQEEYCWRSFYNGEFNYEFAYKPTTENVSYQPYGGGKDQ